MLQQTTVAAVTPFFERWMARFPTVEALAEASEDEVLAYWQGLGYYRRARLLHSGAKAVVERGWPKSAAEWREVPGVGAYTAGAVASIALGERAALVDGNVERVFARLVAFEGSGPVLKKAAWEWAEAVLPEGEVGKAGDWNQALMELGATVCTPKNPHCGKCPVSEWCRAFQGEQVGDFPSPKPEKAWRELSHIMAVPVFQGRFGLRQRGVGEWWTGMWDFPRGDSREELGLEGEWTRIGEFRHVVTVHKISVEVYRVSVSDLVEGFRWVEGADLGDLALPTPARKAVKMLSDHEKQSRLF